MADPFEDECFGSLEYDAPNENLDEDESNTERAPEQPPVKRTTELNRRRRHPEDWFYTISTEFLESKKRQKLEEEAYFAEQQRSRILEAQAEQRALEADHKLKKYKLFVRIPKGISMLKLVHMSDMDTLQRGYLMKINPADYTMKKLMEQCKPIKWQSEEESDDTDDLPNVVASLSTDVVPWTVKYDFDKSGLIVTSSRTVRSIVSFERSWTPSVFHRPPASVVTPDDAFNLEDNSPYYPVDRVLLLYGQMGSGKTTSIRACFGKAYELVMLDLEEFTAASMVSKRLETLMSNHTFSFNSKTRKPCLFVVRGIEIAPSDVLTAFTNFISNKKNVTRPIICTCTNAYASKLRDIRKLTTVVKYDIDPIRAHRLIQKIIEDEDISGVRAGELLETFKYDLRRSMNHLQFYRRSGASQKNGTDSLPSVSMFSAKDMLRILLPFNSRQTAAKDTVREIKKYFSLISDPDFAVQLAYLNAPAFCNAPVKNWPRTINSFIDVDWLTSIVQKSFDFGLMQYYDSLIVRLHLRLRLLLPNYNYMSKINYLPANNSAERDAVLHTLMHSAARRSLHFDSQSALILMAPMLKCMLHKLFFANTGNDPTIITTRIAGLMKNFGLDIGRDNLQQFRIEPPLMELSTFHGQKPPAIPGALANAVFTQILAHRTQLEQPIKEVPKAPKHVLLPRSVLQRDSWTYLHTPGITQRIRRFPSLRDVLYRL